MQRDPAEREAYLREACHGDSKRVVLRKPRFRLEIARVELAPRRGRSLTAHTVERLQWAAILKTKLRLTTTSLRTAKRWNVGIPHADLSPRKRFNPLASSTLKGLTLRRIENDQANVPD